MVETRNPETVLRLLSIDDPADTIAMPGSTDELVELPYGNFHVEVDGLPWDATLTLRYNHARQKVQVVGLAVNVRSDGPEELPSRGLREFQLQALTMEAILLVAKPARYMTPQKEGDRVLMDPANPFGIEVLAGPIDEAFANHLARGRSKAEDSVQVLRVRAAREYERLRASGYTGADIIKDVAKSIGVGRSTAARYLSDEGVLGRTK